MSDSWVNLVTAASAAGVVAAVTKLLTQGAREATTRILRRKSRPVLKFTVGETQFTISRSEAEAEDFLQKYLDDQQATTQSIDEERKSTAQSGEVDRDR